MTYFRQLRKFTADYRIGFLDRLKLLGLYPVFKFHYWYYYGSPFKRKLASRFFLALPKAALVTIQLRFPSFSAPFSIPIWLRPDHLTSFQEIFWAHEYRLKGDWHPAFLIDAGANIGYASLYLAGHYSIRSVLAIEANPQLYPHLERIAQLLGEAGVDMRIAKGALTGSAKELIFQISENSRDTMMVSPSQTSCPSSNQTARALGFPLRSWFSKAGFEESLFHLPTLLKMDIEGGEYDLLENDLAGFSIPNFLVAEIHGRKSRRDYFVEGLSPMWSTLERRTSSGYDDVEVLFAERSLSSK